MADDQSPDDQSPDDQDLARQLAALFRVGSTVVAAIFTAGVVAALIHPSAGTWILGAGCVVLILLPVVRLLLMGNHFRRLRAGWLALASIAVLVLIIAGALTGMVFAV